MWQDPIVTETRLLREQYAKQFNHNANDIFQDILRRQEQPGKTLVTFPSRKPRIVAQQCAPADAQKAARR